MRSHFLGELFTKLDMLVLERLENSNRFEVLGNKVPDWIKYDNENSLAPSLQASEVLEKSHFLQDFLISEAVPFWEKNDRGEKSSGPWSEQDLTRGEYQLEATAIAIGPKNFLIIKRLGQEFAERQASLQKERERALRTEEGENSAQTRQVKPAGSAGISDGGYDDFLMMLNKLLIGVMVIDQDGRITFVNETSKQLLGLCNEGLIDRLWEEVIPFTEEDQNGLMDLIKKPGEERAVIGVNVIGKDGAMIFLKLDVQDDPRYPSRKILLLYDNRPLTIKTESTDWGERGLKKLWKRVSIRRKF